MRQVTLSFIFNSRNQILLAMKKRGFGEGKWNGPGGKVEDGETVSQAAVREIEEEVGVKIEDSQLRNAGLIHFYFSEKPEWNQDVHIFTIRGYDGPVMESDEMKPEWFNISDIPYAQMWEDDIYWFDRMIQGEEIEYEFTFGGDGKILNHKKYR